MGGAACTSPHGLQRRTVAVDKDAAGALVGHLHHVGLLGDLRAARHAAQRRAQRQQRNCAAQPRGCGRIRQQRLAAGRLQRQAARQPVAQRQRIPLELCHLCAGAL